MRKTYTLVILILALLLVISATESNAQSPDSVIYFYDFEAGQGLWQVTNGLWSVGVDPTLPNPVSRSGKMAGALLGGSVPANGFDTYLISPAITLPLVGNNEELRLGFLHWYNFNGYVVGFAVVRIDSGGGRYGPWETISVAYTSNLNFNYWRAASIIISKYAGKRVNVGFRLYGTCDYWGCQYGAPSGRGWRVDDIRIVKSYFNNNNAPVAWDFDQDWSRVADADKWWDAYELFQVGVDTLVSVPSKPNVAGTYLNIPNIPGSAYTTRLVSPGINLPLVGPNVDLILRFRYYLNVNGYAWAEVTVAVDSGGGKWGPWRTPPIVTFTTSTPWIRFPKVLPSEYAGKRVRFAFTIVGSCDYWGCQYGAPSGKGFYIDEVDVFASNSAPQIPILVYPRNNDSLYTSVTPQLRWRLSAAAFSYRLQVARDASFGILLVDSTAIEPITVSLSRVLQDTSSWYYWRVRSVKDADSSSWSTVWRFKPRRVPAAVRELPGHMPGAFVLSQNYPNPFNPTTKINFSIKVASFTTLKVYDIVGREVATLVNERLQRGSYETTFDGRGLASGVYLYRLQAGSFIETKKLLLLR